MYLQISIFYQVCYTGNIGMGGGSGFDAELKEVAVVQITELEPLGDIKLF